MSKPEVRTRWTELLELEEMLSQLMVSALKLPPGAERRDSFILIGCFLERIAAMDAPYRSGPSKTWLKSKNPLSEAVRREAEEDWS
jgi:hypothetical protein